MQVHTDRRYFSSASLKIIAMISMFIDHFGAFILLPYLNTHMFIDNYEQLATLYYACRAIGRLAFPIFCFLLVVGSQHTRNIYLYGQRLIIFAFVSEIPFDLAKSQNILNFAHQNVYFTLSLGMLAIIILEKVEAVPLRLLAVIGISWLNHFIEADYGYIGILLIVMLYSLKDWPVYQSLMGGLFYLFLNPFGCPAFGLTYLYNGQKGRLNSRIYYWFYPAHLLLYAGIRYLLTTK